MRDMMGGETPAEREEMQARLAELDELKRRVGELEERVDFAERLLARQREQERLQP
jgi:polyhydroxyalkanoate synthesis regulator phasin